MFSLSNKKNFPAWVAHCLHLILFSMFVFPQIFYNIDQDGRERQEKSEIFLLALDPDGSQWLVIRCVQKLWLDLYTIYLKLSRLFD